MQRNLATNLLAARRQGLITRRKNDEMRRSCDVFISHRGVDTKRGVSSLLYDHLSHKFGVKCFLDNKNMRPGDKLFDNIDAAIRSCKIGVAVFSPRYCDSFFCLHELALFVEAKKKIIPIFCDVKPSQLRVCGAGTARDVERFGKALEEAKLTVGLAFDSREGNWSDVVTNAGNIVMESLMEIEEGEKHMMMRRRTRKRINNNQIIH